MKALYPGTFDPLTLGHQDVIRRGAIISDEMTIGVALTNKKNPIFSVEERINILEAYVNECHPSVKVTTYSGLTVDYCREHGIGVILRGIRNQLDFEYEYPIASVNSKLNQSVETVFVMTNPAISYISSSMVREVMEAGGAVEDFVSDFVRIQLYKKLGRGDELTAQERDMAL